MFFEITVAILSIAFLVFIILSIPVLLQVRRIAKSMAGTLRMLNKSLPAILRNLEETTAHLNQTAQTVDERTKTLSIIIDHFQALLGIGSDAENDSHVEEGFSFFKILKIAAGVAIGVKLFSKVFFSFCKKEK